MAELVDSHMRPGPWQKVGYFRKVRPRLTPCPAGRSRLAGRASTDAWDTATNPVSLLPGQVHMASPHHALPVYRQRLMALNARL